MKCAVCGKDVGFWAKLGNHTQVCKACTEQGQNRLNVLATSVGWVTNWHQEHAERWLAQYDEIVHKYQVPTTEALQARNGILNGIFKLVESQDLMTDADLEYLVGLGQRYGIAQSGTPDLRDTGLRIALRQAIQAWDGGKPPERECTALVLAKGEVCHWEEPAGLLIQRTRREYVGGYASVSIPLHIVRGARARVGGFKGVPIDKTVLEDGGRGVLHVTNQRVCFTGLNQAVAIPFNKIVSLAGFDEGFEVHTGNEKKPGIFLVPHPELTTELLKRATTSRGDDDSRPKRRRRVPALTVAIVAVLLSAVTSVAGQNTSPSGDSDKSLGDIALQQKLQRDLRDFCSKKKDSKLCKEKSPEKMAETILKESTREQVTKLIVEIEKFTGDDHSWSSGVSTGSGATGPSTAPESKSYQQQLGEILDQLADKTPRQLGNDAVGGVQFPGRDS